MEYSVLHICDYAAAYKGGFISSLEYLRKDLEKDGVGQVYLFPHRALSTKAAEWIEELRADGATVYIQTESFWKNIKLLKKIVKKHNVKKIFRHFNDLYIDIIEYLFCPSIPVVRFFHCAYTASGISHIIRKFIYRKDVFVGVSRAVVEKAMERFSDREIISLENAIILERFSQTDEFERSDKVSCLTMGYNCKVKGVDLTFETFKRIREKYDALLYVVVASHKEEIDEEIKKHFGEKPDWLILLPPTENIGTYYHNTDIILSPSRSEGALPFVVFEAMYCGSIAVVSDIPQQITDKVSSIRYFKSEDIDDYERVLSKAIDDVTKSETESERLVAKEEIVKNYSMQVWADRFKALI